eukprot:1156593-Pelagomonas_calceolata.AAC.10
MGSTSGPWFSIRVGDNMPSEPPVKLDQAGEGTITKLPIPPTSGNFQVKAAAPTEVSKGYVLVPLSHPPKPLETKTIGKRTSKATHTCSLD